MLLLSYLWNVSERMIEELANDSLSVGLFLGIGANERVPDHSTLTLLKNRLIQNTGMKVYEELFDETIKMAQKNGVEFGKLQAIRGNTSLKEAQPVFSSRLTTVAPREKLAMKG